jgi:large subunit ribosomal protein L25
MSAKFELTAHARTVKGKGASRRLRHQEQVPAILYGSGKPAQSILLSHFEVLKALKNEAFYSHILTLHVEGHAQQVVLKDVQRHPYKPRVMHMDFLRIDAAHKIIMHVPLHFTGEDIAPGVKVDKGLVNKLIQDIEIRCLPADLPEFIMVDISNLTLNGALQLTEIVLPKGVELAHKIEDPEHDVVVVNIQLPRAAEEEKPAAAVEEAAPATPAAGASQ